jgi:cysteine-rich repeat protein
MHMYVFADAFSLAGCNDQCGVECGWNCTGGTPTSKDNCTTRCGDGLRVAGKEQCDDNNTVSGDGCSNSCTVELGWYINSSACARSVMYTTCGDARKAGPELSAGRCEDGNTGMNDGCNSTCHVECGYRCSGGSSSSADVCNSTCGDGVLASNEQCDDNNTRPGM